MSYQTPEPVPAGEILESGYGGHLPPPSRPPGSGRRRGVIAGGALAGLALVGAGGWFAWSAFFATGPQPAEALPASTVGYVSVDLDPSGSQKLEALKTLRKFPAFADNVDVDSTDDLREKLFDSAQDSGACPELDFGDDIDSWLGDRFAVAAVDLGEKDEDGDPQAAVVGVLQVDDAGKAEDGLAKLRDCVDSGSSGDDSSSDSAPPTTFGWSVAGDWVVVAESDDIAEQVTTAAADEPLSDDDSFQKWTDEAGDPGILTAYAAPDAGTFIASSFGDFPSAFGGGFAYSCSAPVPPAPAPGEADGYSDDYSDSCDDDYAQQLEQQSQESQDQLEGVLKDFKGGALTVRFDDGSLEVETATDGDFPGLNALTGGTGGDDVLATLPDDTAAAYGIGFEPGWFADAFDYVTTLAGDGTDVDELIQQAEDETGLSLPEDAETLAGESAVIALGGDFDPDSDPSTFPVGVKIKGDAEAITGVMDKILQNPDVPADFSDVVDYDTDGDYVAAGPSGDYRAKLLEDGDLADSDIYQSVVRESKDASSVLFVNFNAFDSLLKEELGDGDQEVVENLEPLGALGVSSWSEDDVSHGLLKITTD